MDDVIIVGSGVSGSFIAQELAQSGMKCVMLEAGQHFTRDTYPDNEADANSQLYWGGGLELNNDASLAFLRPKVVGGGSIVNQALVDRFDDVALDSWREQSRVDFLSTSGLAPWYEKAEQEICIQTIPESVHNGNARVYKRGFERCGYRLARLRRAQRDCRTEEGNDCIVCLAGCPLDSKQSTPVTTLKKAMAAGLRLVPEFEVTRVTSRNGTIEVTGLRGGRAEERHTAGKLVLAAGAIGNSRLLLASGYGETLPGIGTHFYTHPQFMNFGIFDEPVLSHKGSFQALKSDDPNFRKAGFKLENVYGPPVAIAMLLAGFGRRHQSYMRRMPHFACIEIAIRDTQPGRVTLDRRGRVRIEKRLNREDWARYRRGLTAVNNVFRAAGAREIINARWAFGLHLMGGCRIGADPASSVVDERFRLHRQANIFTADSSIFPNAPGINPSLTIMALGKMAAASLLGGR